MWNGTALTLKARPASRKTRPNSRPIEVVPSRANAAAMPDSAAGQPLSTLDESGSPKPTTRKRTSSANAEAFTATDMNAVAGVTAPS